MASDLRQRFDSVRQRIWRAEIASGHPPGQTKIVAVSKKQSTTAIRELYGFGQRDFGESYLQEALPKIHSLRNLDIVWHYIGHVQANKTREIASHFNWVHGVDREKIGRRLSEQRPPELGDLNVCVQINISREVGKSGVSIELAHELAAALNDMEGVALRGLMAIPERGGHEDTTSTSHADMHAIYQALQQRGLLLDTLSMGMSDDLEAAVENGATLVRIGTALFGDRK